MVTTQVEPEACPHCGKMPKILPTLLNTYYVACCGHCETKGCSSRDEAVALWNRHEYEEQLPAPQYLH